MKKINKKPLKEPFDDWQYLRALTLRQLSELRAAKARLIQEHQIQIQALEVSINLQAELGVLLELQRLD